MKQSILILLSLFSFTINAQSVINLDNYEGHYKLKTIEVKINGKPYNFLFDTGAGVTLISSEIVKELNKAEYGRGIGFRMLGEKIEYKKCDSVNIQIAENSFFHSTIGVWDVNKVLPKEWPRIDGAISLGTFKDHCYTIELSKNTITIETEFTCNAKIKDMQKIESRFINGLDGSESDIFLCVNKIGRNWWFLMDSGNLDKNKISHATAREWNIKDTISTGRIETNEIEYKLSGISKISSTVIDDIIYDGVINYDFLAQFVITISDKEKNVWIK